MTSARVEERRSVATIVAALFVVTLAVNLQIPLYKTYADAAGVARGFIALAFAVYVLALIALLIALGGLSNRLGSKVTICLGLAFALAGHAVIIAAPSMRALLLTRLLQAASVALSLGAGTAHIAELTRNPPRAARWSGMAVTLGLGSGAPLTTAVLDDRLELVPASYLWVAAATVLCLVLTLRLPALGRAASARLLRLPLVSEETAPYCTGLFASWSLTGVIIATLPAQLALTGGQRWSGLVVFLATVPGIVIQLAAREPDPRRFARTGYGLLIAAVLLMALGIARHSTALILSAATLSGLTSFGFTYVGGLTAALQTPSADRARSVSGYYLCGYLGLGLPCIAVGYLTEHMGLERALLGTALVVALGTGLTRYHARTPRQA